MSAPISQDEDGYLDLAAIEDAAEWLLAWALRMDTVECRVVRVNMLGIEGSVTP